MYLLCGGRLCCNVWKYSKSFCSTEVNQSFRSVGRFRLTPSSRETVILCAFSNNFHTSSYDAVRHGEAKIKKRLDAERLIRNLSENERQLLRQSLDDVVAEREREEPPVAVDPTTRQLGLVTFSNSIPFVGFGFLDNAIMIVAGDYIDSTIGVSLGISTMAAAGIGNCVSDMAGIGLAGYVEILASRLGIEEPNLTKEQLTMRKTKIAEYLGRGIGIAVGCFIGMFPLLFLH